MKTLVCAACLALCTIGPVAAAAGGTNARSAQTIDRNILHVQVILDHLGFSPGVLDGRPGKSLVAALKGFQESRGLEQTGKIDQPTLVALHPYAAWRPTRTLALTADSLSGPYVNPFPKDP